MQGKYTKISTFYHRFFGKGVLPEEAVITPAKPADKTQMAALVVDEKSALNVFDRAYVDYRKFDS